MSLPSYDHQHPSLVHLGLKTTFCGTLHRQSTLDAKIHQYLGIQYASIPARFRQSKPFAVGSYPPLTDASKHGPICPQIRKSRSPEELLFGIPFDEFPINELKQDEFECLNLNIICPAGLTPDSKVPVMLWVHGGGDVGSGSEWYYDGGGIVRKSIVIKKPVIFVTFNYRIGLLGFAANNMIRDDNKVAGDEGCGNYGLRDQRTAMEWLQANIADFGGDPTNVTLIGSGSGAADIICHLLSRHNATTTRSTTHRLFSRAIIQSPVFEPIQDVASAGWMLSRMMSPLQVGSIDDFRKMDAERLLGLSQNFRAVDDGVWFRDGWSKWFQSGNERGRESHRHHSHGHHLEHLSWQARPGRSGGMGVCTAGAASLLPSPPFSTRRNGIDVRNKSRSKSRSAPLTRSPSRHPSCPQGSPTSRILPPPTSVHSCPGLLYTQSVSPMPLQPIIIGDSASDSLLWSSSVSLWQSAGVVRRLKALCQSLSRTGGILRAYDIGSYTPDDEIVEHVLDLVDDARIAWPTDVLAEAILREGNTKVWRYIFDQEGPARGIPHHAADLMYFFDWKPASLGLGSLLDDNPIKAAALEKAGCSHWEGPFDVDEEEEEKDKPIVSYDPPSLGSMIFGAAMAAAAEAVAAAAAAPEAVKIDPSVLVSSVRSSSSVSSMSSGSSSDISMRSVGDTDWLVTAVDRCAYLRVRDAMQEKWIAFAYGEEPWTPWSGRPTHEAPQDHAQFNHPPDPRTVAPKTTHYTNGIPLPSIKPEKVFIFGPEGETGERGSAIFDGRRRRAVWAEVLEPLGWALVQKLGVELSRGPAGADRTR